MKLLNLPALHDRNPKYLQIGESLREAIRKGQLHPDERLPSSRELARLLQTSKLTVLAALDELVAEGWIVSEFRRGYRVADTFPEKYFRASAPGTRKKIAPHRHRLVREVQLARAIPGEVPVEYDFQPGQGDLRLFPLDEFRSHLRDALKSRHPVDLLKYGSPQGFEPLVHSLERYLRRLRSVQDRPVMVTNGSQEGIFMAIQLLVKPGDTVAMEELSYPPAREALRVAGARIVPIRMGPEGLDAEHFARVAAKRRIRLLFLSPLHQFPTTRTLSAPTRLRVYDTCVRHGIPIIEDDYAHEFHYRSHPLAPMASEDPAGLVIYVSTFSKVLFPSSRVGFLSLPPSLLESFVGMRRILTHQNESVMQSALHRWMEGGGLERYIRRVRNLYHRRRDLALESLGELSARGWKVEEPFGGMAVWVDTGRDSLALSKRLRKRGVFVTPERAYQVKTGPGRHLLIGFASHTPEEFSQGVAHLAQSLT